MNASDLFKAGRLQEAIDAQLKEVKSSPADHGKRLFLFELLAFAGDLDRARKQLDVVKYDELELEAATLNYRRILDAEQLRRRLFSEGLAPKHLADPPEHLKLRLEAVNRLREQNHAEAGELIRRANEAAPVVKGTLNDKPFEVLRDCDDLFGHVLEVYSQGAYFWVPFEHIEVLTVNPPKTPRDLLWLVAHLDVRNGPSGDAFLPTLYPGSHEHPDMAVKLGRMTDWKESSGGPVLGVGLRQYLVGDDAMSLLEWRVLEIEE